ncbi:MAG: substrate-binding domain-containing protein [Chloroflexota bacterium]
MTFFVTDTVATTPYAVDIIRGAQDAASEQDHVLLVVSASDTSSSIEDAIEFLLERQVVGIIYAAMFHHVVDLPDNIYQVPTALANCYVKQRDLPSAVPDEFIGAYRATRALLEAGHTRIAHLQVVPPASDAREGRLAGYQAALEAYDIPFDTDLCIDTLDHRSDENFHITQQLLAMDNPPTGFFCANDRMTIATYQAIMHAGLRIPDDIGVVGFDNQLDVVQNLKPQLTSVQLPHYEMGAWAFNQLLINTSEPIQAKIDCPLVARASI